jgi:hypothetical protein
MNLADAPRGDTLRTTFLPGAAQCHGKTANVERIVLERELREDAGQPLGVVVLAVLC